MFQLMPTVALSTVASLLTRQTSEVVIGKQMYHCLLNVGNWELGILFNVG